jgi:hypothetical protein|tara:strand:+ start:138 stop:1763 length:1626 start_codon:yes stop_codon:yes gene_type:complete
MFTKTKSRWFLLVLLPLVLLATFLTTIFLHESPQPWIFGRYSLPYFTFLLLTTASIIFIFFIYFRFKRESFKIYGGLLVGLCFFIFLIEIGGQVYAAFHPSYRVLRYIPEETLGWKLAPNLEFVSTGDHWYAREFSVPIKINSLGFRDLDRKQKKPSGAFRVALMGDSFVEALQVPFSKTAGQLLEKKLNDEFYKQNLGVNQFEVLNFGIGAHGTDQALFTYLKYAKKFNPNYVFLFYFDTHIWRTTSDFYCSTFGSNESECMRIRPGSHISIESAERIRNILGLEEFHKFVNKLGLLKSQNKKFPMTSSEYFQYINLLTNKIDEKTIQNLSIAIKEESISFSPPKDYEYFISKQQELISSYFNGARQKIKDRKSFMFSLFSQLNDGLLGFQKLNQFTKEELSKLAKIYKINDSNQPLQGNEDFPLFEVGIALNLKVIHQMAKVVQENGSKLVLVDGTKNIVRYGQLPAALGTKIMEKFCELNNIGYIPLHDQLNKFNKEGVVTHWKYDYHFNEDGQKIFSNSMFDYLKKNKIYTQMTLNQ